MNEAKEILLSLGATIHKGSVMEAAEQLLEAVEKQHDKPPPLKYSTPYGAVNALRLAVDAAKQAVSSVDLSIPQHKTTEDK